MMQRWYDKDPTLSMAVSLLRNATPVHQEMVTRYMSAWMETQGISDCAQLKTRESHIQFIFPQFRRKSFELPSLQLIETMKHLSQEDQSLTAVQLINYIYILDSGLTELPLEELELEEHLALIPESG